MFVFMMLVEEGDIFYIKIIFSKEIKFRIMLMINFLCYFLLSVFWIVIDIIVFGIKCMVIIDILVILKLFFFFY